MWYVLGALLLLLGIIVIPVLRRRSGAGVTNLGWMSTRWLAEHRASHQ